MISRMLAYLAIKIRIDGYADLTERPKKAFKWFDQHVVEDTHSEAVSETA